MEDSDTLVDDDDVDGPDETGSGWEGEPPGGRGAALSQGCGPKPMRQRIEEYFERKRLREALQEDIDDSLFL